METRWRKLEKLTELKKAEIKKYKIKITLNGAKFDPKLGERVEYYSMNWKTFKIANIFQSQTGTVGEFFEKELKYLTEIQKEQINKILLTNQKIKL